MTTSETIRQAIQDLFAEHGTTCVRAVFTEYFDQPTKLTLPEIMEIKGIASRMTVYNRIAKHTLPEPDEREPKMWWDRERFMAEDRLIQAELVAKSRRSKVQFGDGEAA